MIIHLCDIHPELRVKDSLFLIKQRSRVISKGLYEEREGAAEWY